MQRRGEGGGTQIVIKRTSFALLVPSSRREEGTFVPLRPASSPAETRPIVNCTGRNSLSISICIPADLSTLLSRERERERSRGSESSRSLICSSYTRCTFFDFLRDGVIKRFSFFFSRKRSIRLFHPRKRAFKEIIR